MFRKNIVWVLIVGLLFFGATGLAKAADETQGAGGATPESKAVNNCAWSNLKFCEFLAKKLGISLGEGEKDMSDADKYAALTNALSQKGITYFSTVKAEEPIQCCGATEAFFVASGATEVLATCDLKLNYLIQNGLLKLPTPGSTPCDALCSVDVEPFTPARTERRTDPPGEEEENPSSHS
jgi:hypothetical protein